MPNPQKAMALPRSFGGNASSNTACDNGCKQPPEAPCKTRQTIKKGKLGENPQQNEDTVKPTTDAISKFLRPNRLASHPVIGSMIAFATR